MSQQIVTLLGMLTIAGQVLLTGGILLLIAHHFKKKFSKDFQGLIQLKINFMKENATLLAFIVAITAFFGSMFFSNILGYYPCLLCWYQRIAIFPLSLILLIALITNDLKVYRYVIPLASIGALIAGYHYIVQISPAVACSAQGGVDCAVAYTNVAGYVTIPLMAFTACLLIIALMLVGKKK